MNRLNKLTIVQLKEILKKFGLSGNKTELIARILEADPGGNECDEIIATWARQLQSEDQLNETFGSEINNVNTPQNVENASYAKELEFLERERHLIERKRELLRQEKELMQVSPVTVNDIGPRITINIKAVGELLSDFNGTESFAK